MSDANCYGYAMPFVGVGTNEYPLVGVVDGDVDFGDALENAVLMSLFTWRRAADDDALPVEGERQGWWGDTFSEGNDKIGSRLWLLSRSVLTDETVELARTYTLEALQWLVEDGIAASVDVQAVRLDTAGIALTVTVSRDDGSKRDFRYDNLWEVIRGS